MELIKEILNIVCLCIIFLSVFSGITATACIFLFLLCRALVYCKRNFNRWLNKALTHF